MIAMLAITAYAPTLKTGFLWDDHITIEANPWIREWSFHALKHDFSSDVFDGHGDKYYRPLATLANRVDFTLWGLRPAGFHLTNLLIHLGNALLIAELVLALSVPPLAAFLTASLFAVHPIGAEQLMIISGRAELMSFFFSLTAVLLLLKKGRGATTAGWIAYLAALFSKESGVMTPFVLALVFYAQREPAATYRRLGPMILALLPYLALRQSIVGPTVNLPSLWLTFRFVLQEFPSVIVRYLALLLVPWNLHSHRLLPQISPIWPLILLLCVGVGAYGIRRYRHWAVFCIGWFLLALLPKMPVMIYGNFMLDHWAYPASLAVLLPLAWLVHRGWKSSKDRVRTLTGLLYFVVIIAGSLLVHLNVALRGTDEKMYRWALHFTTSNPVKSNLGVLLLQTGRPGEAIPFLEEVRQVYPEDSKTTRALALAYWDAGYPRVAIRYLKEFLMTHPDDPLARAQLNNMKKHRAPSRPAR
ncbi:MAG: hypothetical protein A2992_00400 [Elusimicrobia bacterium RIFCSPLOWO2_01_FULL_59_12]|nr:MAG: hypothetical protein A2992_00400 [Elusimicrobia bacterium RIFCSPLOWO2_01_FULL_59_12]